MSGSRDNLARQSRGCGLAVGTSDSDYSSGEKLGRQFDFTNDILAKGTRLNQRRRIRGNAWAHDDEVLTAESALSMPARLHGNALIEQNRNLVFQLVLGLGVRDRHACALGFQKKGRGDTGFPESDNQHAFVDYIHEILFHHRVTEPQGNQEDLLPPAACPLVKVIDLSLLLSSLCLCVSVVNSYLNFKVVSANSANTSDAIQKRTIILDSDQPSNSK
jgi:hypothetical protein